MLGTRLIKLSFKSILKFEIVERDFGELQSL